MERKQEGRRRQRQQQQGGGQPPAQQGRCIERHSCGMMSTSLIVAVVVGVVAVARPVDATLNFPSILSDLYAWGEEWMVSSTWEPWWTQMWMWGQSDDKSDVVVIDSPFAFPRRSQEKDPTAWDALLSQALLMDSDTTTKTCDAATTAAATTTTDTDDDSSSSAQECVAPTTLGAPMETAVFPIHFADKENAVYQRFLDQCRNFYPVKKQECLRYERDRLSMNRLQPQAMQNYTVVGFQKVRAPSRLFQPIQELWKVVAAKDKRSAKTETEQWSPGNTYVNHWEAPTKMWSVDKHASHLRPLIWQWTAALLQNWTGIPDLQPSSLYGIRVYGNQSILAPHVDRLPLVTSAIINVDQDVDEPWPLEVVAHDGKRYNVTLEPGEMLLYESHSVIHGRPYPLQGRFVANLFVHFEPDGHSLRHERRINDILRSLGDKEAASQQQDNPLERAYKKALEKNTYDVTPTISEEDFLPPFIAPNSPEAKRWRQEYDYPAVERTENVVNPPGGVTDAHRAAMEGNAEKIRNIAASPAKYYELTALDKNGWQPLHEAARAGHTRVIQALLDVVPDLDVNARTNRGHGATALWWAVNQFGHQHPTSVALKKAGGKMIAPSYTPPKK